MQLPATARLALYLALATGIAADRHSVFADDSNSTLNWHTKLDSALVESRESGKPILMEINGRPWCPPCNAQGEKIIEQRAFEEWAREKVVLLDIKVGEAYDRTAGNPDWWKLFKKYKLAAIPVAILLDSNSRQMGIVYPKSDVSQWIGAAENVITDYTLTKGRQKTAANQTIIPFHLTKWNNISVPATLNDRFAVNLMFHTAVDSVSLTKATTEKFPEIVFEKQANIESWGGKSTSRVGSTKLTIASLPANKVTIFEGLHSGHDTDGKFGPPQLHASIFSVDFDKEQIQLLQKLPQNLSGWQEVKLDLDSGIPFITADVGERSRQVSHRFMLHSGYSGFVLLDDVFVSQHEFLNELEVVKQSELKDSAGNILVTKEALLPEFRVGDTTFISAPVSFFSGAIGRQKFSVLGGDFLKRFNLLFDFEKGKLYLKKNSRFDAEHFKGK